MKPRIYIDTSVIGGCYDDEFQGSSKKLIDLFKAGQAIALISELTRIELKDAPLRIQHVVSQIPVKNIEELKLTQESSTLAQNYITESVIGQANSVDAEHIAIATINKADILVSWNFQHIVNLERIRGYNSVNLKWGYPILEIRTPSEVISYD